MTIKSSIRKEAARIADETGMPVLTDGKEFFVIRQNPEILIKKPYEEMSFKEKYNLANDEVKKIKKERAEFNRSKGSIDLNRRLKDAIHFRDITLSIYDKMDKQMLSMKQNPQESCKCKGVNLLLDMTELYKGLGDKKFKAHQLDREKALKITDSLLNIVSENDVYLTERSGLWKSFLREAKNLNIECKEGLGEQCIYALENMRAAIHGDFGIRAKILCDPKGQPFSKENDEVLKSMYALRGAFYGTPTDAVNRLKTLKTNLLCNNG